MQDQCYYRISVKGLVVDERGRILLSRESTNQWELLGGGLEHNEEPLVCLRREIAEETGLEITYSAPTPCYFITTQRAGANTFIANIIYEIRLKDLNFTPSDECQELRFCSIQEAAELNLFPNVRKLLEVFDPALHTASYLNLIGGN